MVPTGGGKETHGDGGHVGRQWGGEAIGGEVNRGGGEKWCVTGLRSGGGEERVAEIIFPV